MSRERRIPPLHDLHKGRIRAFTSISSDTLSRVDIHSILTILVRANKCSDTLTRGTLTGLKCYTTRGKISSALTTFDDSLGNMVNITARGTPKILNQQRLPGPPSCWSPAESCSQRTATMIIISYYEIVIIFSSLSKTTK
ncbi:hypothetical protein Bbelb_019270 [Branchiostoma belcheri]|nr:hypothetical protein Bbelb_019270 [Branchiostoma belcheri]